MSLIFNKNDKGEMIGKLSNGDFFNIGKSKFLIYLTNNVDDIETTFDEIKQKIKSEYRNSNELDKIMQIIPINWRFFLTEAIQYSPLRGMR